MKVVIDGTEYDSSENSILLILGQQEKELVSNMHPRDNRIIFMNDSCTKEEARELIEWASKKPIGPGIRRVNEGFVIDPPPEPPKCTKVKESLYDPMLYPVVIGLFVALAIFILFKTQ